MKNSTKQTLDRLADHDRGKTISTKRVEKALSMQKNSFFDAPLKDQKKMVKYAAEKACEEQANTELIERIVILYANFSGRDSERRAEFREELEKIFKSKGMVAKEQAKLDSWEEDIEWMLNNCDRLVKTGWVVKSDRKKIIGRISQEIQKARKEEEAKWLKILNSGRRMYQLGRKEERERIKKEVKKALETFCWDSTLYDDRLVEIMEERKKLNKKVLSIFNQPQ